VFWQLFLMAIAPNVIMPLFNQFTPLEDEALKERVNGLMQRAGFTAKGFFVMDGSKRSAHSNAFFTGFGASKRVVFFDTLLKQLTPSEMEAVLAHELGHFKHRHIFKMMLSSFAMSLHRLGRHPKFDQWQRGCCTVVVHAGCASVHLFVGAHFFLALKGPRVRSGRLCCVANACG
jgi:hypothetical protein